MWRNIAVVFRVHNSEQSNSRGLRCLSVLWLSEDVRLVMMRWSVAVWSLNRPGSRTLQWKKPESEGRALTMDREEEDDSENLPTTRHNHQCMWHHRRDCPELTGHLLPVGLPVGHLTASTVDHGIVAAEQRGFSPPPAHLCSTLKHRLHTTRQHHPAPGHTHDRLRGDRWHTGCNGQADTPY